MADAVEGFDSKLGVWIDDISDSVRGRWRINYSWSRGDDIGQFSGWRAGNSISLDLRLDTPYETPMGSLCTGYKLELTLEAGDTIGPSSYESETCQFKPMPLRFIEGDPLEWPFSRE